MENFYVECPKFEIAFWEQGGKSRRDYAHPLDTSIIKFLDNPAINAIFRPVVSMLAETTYGPMIASGIPISEKNYPHINEIVEHCVKTLNIKRPYVIVSSSLQGLNAMAFGNDEEPYVAVSPLMMRTMNPTRMAFVIGHECGHVAMGHMVYHSVLSIATGFSSAVPIIGPIVNQVGFLPLRAWSRRSEITADRAGMLCCGNIDEAKGALLQLEMPFMDTADIDMNDYVANSERYLKKGFLRKINEFDDAHPIIPKRIRALDLFVSSMKYAETSGQAIPANGLSDKELETQIEEIIKIV